MGEIRKSSFGTKTSVNVNQATADSAPLSREEQKIVQRYQDRRVACESRVEKLARRLSGVMFMHW